MTNKDITKIYFQGNEIVALYQGDTLIFKKSEDVPSKPTGVYKIKGTVNPFSGEQSIQLCVNGKQEQFNVNSDNTFEHTFVNVPITNMDYFTQPCSDKLKTIDLSNFDTSQVTSMSGMFHSCTNLTSLDVSNFDTSNVTDMSQMFNNIYYITSLDLSSFNTSKVTSMSYMFNGDLNLTSLDLSSFNTSKVTSMSNMFFLDGRLIDLYMNFDTSNVTNMESMFLFADKLENVVGKFEGTKNDLNLSRCPLTPDSAMVFINGLATVTEKRTLSLRATTYDSLTTEQIAIATSKGWTVTRG